MINTVLNLILYRMAIKEKRKAIKEYETNAYNIYASGVEQDQNPQKYLYQSFRRRWKFYKIYQMMEKLALLGVTLYTPQANDKWKRLAYATAIAGFSCLMVVVGHPLMDKWEASLDVTSRLANLCNSGIGLLLVLDVGIPTIAVNIIMIGVNGLNIGMFLFLIIVSPIR